jgi:nucleoside-diphosphate-sugar epimerase
MRVRKVLILGAAGMLGHALVPHSLARAFSWSPPAECLVADACSSMVKIVPEYNRR